MIFLKSHLKIGKCFKYLLIFGSFLVFNCSRNPKEKHLALQAYSSFNLEFCDTIASSLHSIYGCKVSILSPKEIPKSTFVNSKSPRYRADRIIKILKDQKPDSIDFIMGLTNRDISTTKKDENGNTLKPISKYQDWGIFGLGYRPGSSSVVSSFRFSNVNREKFLERLKKICTRELGHNLGLKHCPNKNCVMTDAAETIKTIDNVQLKLCKECRRILN